MATTTEIGEALTGVLKRGRDAHRCFAAQALGRIGHGPAVAALIERLGDEDEDVRIDAAEALGRLGDPRAGAALLESLLEDPCGDVKTNATRALGALGFSEAAPVLRRLARERGDDIAWDIDAEADGWDDWLDVQIAAIEALGALGAVEAVPDIVAAIDDEMGQDLTAAALPALSRLGDSGVAALTRFLSARDARTRRRAVRALSASTAETATTALLAALDDDSPDVRKAALEGLAARDPAEPRLVRLLDDPDAGVRAAATRLCGRHAPEHLAALLDDHADAVQIAAIDAFLAAPETPRPDDLVFRLRVKLRGPSPAVSPAAARALVALDPKAALDDLREQIADAACPAEVRRAAAKGLGDLGGEAAAHALIAAVGDDDRAVRLEALGALARLANADTAPQLALQALCAALAGELLGEPEPEEPDETEPEAENPTDPAASPETSEPDGDAAETDETDESAADAWPSSTLASVLGDEETAAEIMTPAEPITLDAEDLEYLALARHAPRKRRVSPDEAPAAAADVPRVAARVLGDLSDPTVAEALAEALGARDDEIRRAATDSLARMATRGVPLPDAAIDALVRVAATDGDRDARLFAVRALGASGAVGDETIAPRLADDDDIVRAEAALAMAAIGAVDARVAALLDDASAGVRLAAARALARAGGADAVARLVDFAFAEEGMHCRDAARLLRDLDRDAAARAFLRVLDTAEKERVWRVAIDALEEMYRPEASPDVRLVA